MLDFFAKAGILIYPLGLCSLVACTITIERMFALRRSRVLPREIVEVVDAVQPSRDLSVALQVVRKNPGVLANIMRAGLENADQPWEIMRDTTLDVGRQETSRLERNLVWLQTVAQAAPLLGLLGTVLGMMKVFTAISVAGLGNPKVLSEGISEAMITTAVGLGIGIPALIAYNLLEAKAEGLVTAIEAHAGELVTRLRRKPAAGAAE